jgi:hypothetical protein
VSTVSLKDPRLDRALGDLERGEVDGAQRAAMQRLTDELDEAAWNIQAKVDSGQATNEQYLKSFALARAASATAFALEPDPRKAAMEAVYEAQAALGDLKLVTDLAFKILDASV